MLGQICLVENDSHSFISQVIPVTTILLSWMEPRRKKNCQELSKQVGPW